MIKKHLMLNICILILFCPVEILCGPLDCKSDDPYCDNNAGGLPSSDPAVETQSDSGQTSNPEAPGPETNDKTGDPVNSLSGEPWVTVTDFSYNRVGFPLKYERYYRDGVMASNLQLRLNWMSNYDWSIYFNVTPSSGASGITAILTTPHKAWKFVKIGNEYLPQAGCFFKLEETNVPYIFRVTDKNGIVYTFSIFLGWHNARLIEIRDLNQNYLRIEYEKYLVWFYTQYFGRFCNGEWAARMKRVVSSSGETYLTFEYDEVGATPTGGPMNASVWDLIHVNVPYNSSYSCDGSGIIKRVVSSVGDVLDFKYEYDFSNNTNITRVNRFPSGDNAVYRYLSGGARLIALDDPLMPPGYKHVTFERNPAGRPPYPGGEYGPPEIPRQYPVSRVLNGRGQPIVNYQYSEAADGGKITEMTGPNGFYQKDIYDTRGYWIEKQYMLDGILRHEYYERNDGGLITKITDGNGNETEMEYDALGNMTHRKDAEGYEETYTYNGISRMTYSKDKNQKERTYVYNSRGNLTDVYEPLGKHTSCSYYSNGLLRRVTDANANPTNFTYDTNGNVRTVTDAENVTTSFLFDNRSRMTRKYDALNQPTEFVWNNRNLLERMNNPDTTYRRYGYDDDKNCNSATDEKLNTTSYIFDADSNLTDIFAPGNIHMRNTFDAYSNRMSFIDGRTKPTTFVYNEQNLIHSKCDLLNKGVTYAYDGGMRLIKKVDSRGVVTSHEYFHNNRLKRMAFTDGTAPITFNYDGNGNRTHMDDAEGLKIYSYDELNRQTSVINQSQSGLTTQYTYDMVGRRKSVRNDLIGTIAFNYWRDNRLQSVIDFDGQTTRYFYNRMKAVTLVQYPGNIVQAVYDYDPVMNRLKSINNINSKGEILSRYSYTYDAVGNRDSVTDLTGPTTYSYDNVYRLTFAKYPGAMRTFAYGYDTANNRTNEIENGVSVAWAYNDVNEIEKITGKENYGYDDAGNMSYKREFNGADIARYKWDALNRLKMVERNEADKNIQFTYNGDNVRVRKYFNNGETTNYIMDGLSILAERNGDGTLVKKHVPGLCYVDDKNEKYYYLYDGRGNVANLVDARGNLVQAYSYDAFGCAQGDTKDGNALRYVGKNNVYTDDDVELQYMWNRWYDSNLGMFISRDPISFAGGQNLYTYCGNNPVNWVDPWGLDTITIGGIQSGGAGVGGVRETGVVIGYSSQNGLQVGIIQTTGAGPLADVGGFVGMYIEVTTASDINQLSGRGGSASFAAGEGAQIGVGLGGGQDYLSAQAQAGFGLSPLPVSSGGNITDTTVYVIIEGKKKK